MVDVQEAWEELCAQLDDETQPVQETVMECLEELLMYARQGVYPKDS